MAKSVLELAVGTGQWDAGLKKAKSALDNFTQANGGLQQALEKESQKMQQFVRMMGGMESTAKTAKGQMNDYKSTIEQLTMQYNRMSEAQKKVVGQDYLQAIEQMKQKYQSVNKEIQDMNRSLKNVEMPEMKGGGLFSGIGSKMEGALAVFGGNLMTKAAGAVASLGSEMADMVKQGVEMAKAGEGIRIAFERLGRGDILQGLREATHGTVTDLELMKAAVKFNDFKLPVEELGTMLAFAQQKAKDTGQSVDYMVDSIVTGLGRKSLMILDNLGLSATEIRERMKETGDMTKAVGAIIRDQMAKAGDYVETAADRAAQANVSLQNKMEELGRKFAPVEEASNQLWTSMKIGILDIIGGPLATLLNSLTEAGRLKNALNGLNGEEGSGNTKVGEQLKKLQVIKKAGGSDYIFNSTLSGMLEDYNRQIMAFDTQIKDLKRKAGEDMEGNMAAVYESRIKDIDIKQKALRVMRDQLAAGAKEITNPKPAPTTPVVPPVKPTKPTKDLDAEQQVQQKINDLLKEALTADASRQGEIRQQVAELQKQQEKYKDIKNIAQGILPKDKDAVFTIDGQLSEETKKNLREIENVTIDDKTMTVTANTQEAMQKVQELIGQVSTTTLQMKVKPVEMTTGLSGFNEQTISAWTAMMKSDLQKADLGSARYSSLTHSMEDMSRLTQTVQSAIKLGLEVPQDTVQQIFERIFDGENMPADMYASMIQKFIDEFKERTGKDLQVGEDGSLSTGTDKGKENKQDNIVKHLDKFNGDFSKMTGGVSSIVSGIQSMGVEIPKEIQNVIGVLSGVSSILSGITTLLALIQIDTKMTAATNTVKAIPVIGWAMANGGIVPKAADGRFIGGNSMSGDNIFAGNAWVNSGELVLNRAQQGVLADALGDGSTPNIKIDWVLKGDALYAVMNNNGRRTGRGEVVQRNRI